MIERRRNFFAVMKRLEVVGTWGHPEEIAKFLPTTTPASRSRLMFPHSTLPFCRSTYIIRLTKSTMWRGTQEMLRQCQLSIKKFVLFQAKFYRSKNSKIWSTGAKVDRSTCETRDDCDPSVNLLRSRVPQLWISGHRHQPGPPLSFGRYHQRPYRHPPRAYNGARPW